MTDIQMMPSVCNNIQLFPSHEVNIESFNLRLVAFPRDNNNNNNNNKLYFKRVTQLVFTKGTTI